MANSKVSDLTETTTITDADEFWINDGGTSKRITKANLEGDLAIAASQLSDVTSTAAEINILDGVTSTATELNLLDGVTATTAELNILDGVTSSAAELNKLDGLVSSHAANGYQELPGGLIIQWGVYTSSQDSDQTFNFPIAFPTTGTVIQLTPESDSSDTDIGSPWGAKIASTTTFVVSREGEFDGNHLINITAIGY